MKKWVFIILLLSFTAELASTFLCKDDSFSYSLSEKPEDPSKKLKEEEDNKKNDDFFQDFYLVQPPQNYNIASYKHYEDDLLTQVFTPPTPPPDKA